MPRRWKISQGFKRVIFEHIPMTENERADRLSRLATTYYRELPKGIGGGPIIEYLTQGVLPSDSQEAKKVQNRSFKYQIYKDELYMKSWDGPLLTCVSTEDVPKLLAEIHEGWCGSHIGARSLAIKVTRAAYYWPTLVKDATAYVKKCDAYQRMRNAPQLPTSTLTPVVSSIPFAMCGIDLVGKLPKAKGGAEFAILAVDYFSKWVEAAPLKKTKSEDVIQFLWKNILTRFGIPKILVLDNGPQFEGQVLADFCEKYGIEH
ncbi:hypothetical protein LIER_39497 [Lithospermum erythrorhizon]|uniref:Integrase catalytic domain-containing protein n=1 Tax=Lithospermum erythrorhizon TaxID=34254 RepID=A0AAV3QIE1_LITER